MVNAPVKQKQEPVTIMNRKGNKMKEFKCSLQTENSEGEYKSVGYFIFHAENEEMAKYISRVLVGGRDYIDIPLKMVISST